MSAPDERAALKERFEAEEGPLQRAVAAAERNDVLTEEAAIQEGLQRAREFDWSTRAFMKRVESLQRAGQLRKAEFLGTVTKMGLWRRLDFDQTVNPMAKIWVSGRNEGVDRIDIWRDRVVTDRGDVFVVDGDVHATVDTAGAITQTKQASAVGAIGGALLPGSALIPSLVLARTDKHDSRELFLLLEHPTWAILAQVDPKESPGVRKIAAALNQEARSRAALNPPPSEETPEAEALPAQLEALASLHDSGALTDDEFDAAKRRLLDDS